MEIKENKIEQKRLNFSAISPYIEENMPEIVEVTDGRGDWVKWGRDNKLGQFYLDLYKHSETLSAAVESVADYALGDGIIVNGEDGDEDMEALYRKLAFDFTLYGYCAIEVTRNPLGDITRFGHIPADYLRTNETCETFYYSKNWNKDYKSKTLVLPRYDKDLVQPTSVLYLRNNTYFTYGYPRYASVVEAPLCEKLIAEYNINQISNGFSAGYAIAFCNGIPTSAVQEETEDLLNDKFCGSSNANRLLVSFSPDTAHRPIITKLEQDNADGKYEATTKWAREAILTAFRASPNLLGISLENAGFNTQEFSSAFKLFNRTSVRPVQQALNRMFARIGIEIENKPFVINFDE